MTIKLHPNCTGVHRRVVRRLLEEGYTIHVYLEELGGAHEFTNPLQALDLIEAVDGGADFSVRLNGKHVGNVSLAIGGGNEYHETVPDWSWRMNAEGAAFYDLVDGIVSAAG